MVEQDKVPQLTVDIILGITPRAIVLIERNNSTFGCALPSGFVDYVDSLE